MLTRRTHLFRAVFLAAACTLAASAIAQNNPSKPVANWPTKPIKILVGFPGGTTPDMAARTLAEPLSRALGQPIVIENRPGASGNIAADLVA
jgi:tripartite-type tricarboxylate transporter receptor subunit TctC